MPLGKIPESMLAPLLAALEQEERFAFFETTRISDEDRRSLLFRRPVGRLICRAGDDGAGFLARAEEELQKGRYLAGWFAYEFGYLLEPALARLLQGGDRIIADFGIYNEPHIYDHALHAFSGAGPWPGEGSGGGPAGGSGKGDDDYSIRALRLSQDKDLYCQRIQAIKDYIAAGDTYQVNYTIRLLFDLHGSPSALYRSLRRNQSVSYCAYLRNGDESVLSMSPELFFRKDNDLITVRPMKGTIRRGRTVDEDREFARFLREDIKNRSENVMIVDLLRNDLGRLSPVSGGGVRTRSLFDVETFETLHQLTSTVEAAVLPDLPLVDLFQAIFPCGSVTGAPKIRTMEIIHELEDGPRGVYTGAIGFLTPERNAVFNVPIRTVELRGNRGEMGIGSGIVWDSDPEAEWEECSLKGGFLTRATPEFELIETLLWRPGSGYWLYDFHLERLAGSAGYFGFPCDMKEVVARLAGIVEGRESHRSAQSGAAPGLRVRLTLAGDGRVAVTAQQWDISGSGNQGPGPLRVRFSDKRVDSGSPFLFHKTTHRTLYEEELSLARKEGFFEVLFVNGDGEVTEGSFTTLFIENNGIVYTPPLSSGLLPGVFRRHLLQSEPDRVKEKILHRIDLERADALYVGNSVRGLVRVVLDW